jgi:putative component of membrane protein insertase Oxa1/YidC/SpoIIIJ protein YidD
VVPSYNFLSQDTWKHCKLGTSCSLYALDSSSTTHVVEEIWR